VKPLGADEVWDLAGYESQRDAFRSAVIALKKIRRVAVGDRLTLVFENRSTLLFQVQEMLRVERLSDPRAVQQELDVYNELMPGESELSATLFIEITDPGGIRPELDRLVGIDRHVALELGDHGIRARFDERQMEEDRISAVHYLRFPLDAAARAALADPRTPARLRVDHPACRAEAVLAPATRASLLEDLAGRAGTLLPRPPAPAGAGSGRDELIFRVGAARAVRPARPRAPGHVVVEPVEGAVTLLDASPELLAECQAAVQRAARELCERHGSCRIESAASPDEPLRYHILAGRG
jgi:hypothetical protein